MSRHDYRRLAVLTGLNGFSIALFAALATLLSAIFSFDWSSVLAGLAITASALLEVKGHFLLKSGHPDGLLWARRSQVGVLLCLFSYAAFSLFRLSPDNLLQGVSPLTRDLLMQYYGVDEMILGELLFLVGQATYAAVMAATLLYQGGLYWYYGSRFRRLAAVERSSKIPPEEEGRMPTIIHGPAIVEAAGNKPKKIEEYIGRVNSGSDRISVARMKSPGGWVESGQTPEFDEYTVVLQGVLRVSWEGGTADIESGQAVITRRGEWVQYSTPFPGGAEYIAVCLPAFSPGTVHRDE